jgi:hypothetical protein
MILNCANPNCTADFLNLYEGEWIVIELPDRTVERYWLCGACAPHLCVVYDPMEGVTVVARPAIKKSGDRETFDCEDPPGRAA